jgi:hypothetical protein
MTAHRGKIDRLEMIDHPGMNDTEMIGERRGREMIGGTSVGRTAAVVHRDTTGETASASNATFIDDRRCRQVIPICKAQWSMVHMVHTKCHRLPSNRLAIISEGEAEHCG